MVFVSLKDRIDRIFRLQVLLGADQSLYYSQIHFGNLCFGNNDLQNIL